MKKSKEFVFNVFGAIWPFYETILTLFRAIWKDFAKFCLTEQIQAVKIEPKLGRNDQSWAKNVLESEELS